MPDEIDRQVAELMDVTPEEARVLTFGFRRRHPELGVLLARKRVEVHAILGRDDRELTDAERTAMIDTTHRLATELRRACDAITARDPEYTRGKCTLYLADAQRSIAELHRLLYLTAFEADQKEAPGEG